MHSFNMVLVLVCLTPGSVGALSWRRLAGTDAGTAEQPEEGLQAEADSLPRLRTPAAGSMARQRSSSAPVTPLSRLKPQMEALRGGPEAAAAALASLDDADREGNAQPHAEAVASAGSDPVLDTEQPHGEAAFSTPTAEGRPLHRLASSSSANIMHQAGSGQLTEDPGSCS